MRLFLYDPDVSVLERIPVALELDRARGPLGIAPGAAGLSGYFDLVVDEDPVQPHRDDGALRLLPAIGDGILEQGWSFAHLV